MHADAPEPLGPERNLVQRAIGNLDPVGEGRFHMVVYMRLRAGRNKVEHLIIRILGIDNHRAAVIPDESPFIRGRVQGVRFECAVLNHLAGRTVRIGGT